MLSVMLTRDAMPGYMPRLLPRMLPDRFFFRMRVCCLFSRFDAISATFF